MKFVSNFLLLWAWLAVSLSQAKWSLSDISHPMYVQMDGLAGHGLSLLVLKRQMPSWDQKGPAQQQRALALVWTGYSFQCGSAAHAVLRSILDNSWKLQYGCHCSWCNARVAGSLLGRGQPVHTWHMPVRTCNGLFHDRISGIYSIAEDSGRIGQRESLNSQQCPSLVDGMRGCILY